MEETDADATEGDPEQADGSPPRPAHCRAYTRDRVAQVLPELVTTLLEQAGKGSLPHWKMLLQLSGLDTAEVIPQAGRKGKSLETVLKERWAQLQPADAPQRENETAVDGEDG